MTMSSIGKTHCYYAKSYTMHVIRGSGDVEVFHNRPFTEHHASEANSMLYAERPGVHQAGLPLYAATNLVESWNNRYNHVRNHFPRFFYTVE